MTATTLRITAELHALLRKTAHHTGLDVSDVIRRAARGIRNGRPVIQIDVAETYYKQPGEVIRVRDLAMPEGIQPETFRRLLALRCLEALATPKNDPPKFKEQEGKDYIIEEPKE